MQYQFTADELLKAFADSVTKVLDETMEMSKKVEAVDSDPERTKAHHLDRILRKWFMTGGGLGY